MEVNGGHGGSQVRSTLFLCIIISPCSCNFSMTFFSNRSFKWVQFDCYHDGVCLLLRGFLHTMHENMRPPTSYQTFGRKYIVAARGFACEITFFFNSLMSLNFQWNVVFIRYSHLLSSTAEMKVWCMSLHLPRKGSNHMLCWSTNRLT